MKQLYYHGSIITMEDDEPLAEALLVEDGRIKAVGSEQAVRKFAGQDAVELDLQGHALLPAFIDAHSHLTAVATTLGLVDLSAAKDFKEIKEKLDQFKEERKIEPGQWINGFGYDQSKLKEQAAPTIELLDAVSTEHPILVSHASGHMGVVNTAGLKELGITAATPDPEGGRIGRDENDEPNGYLEETAFTTYGAKIPRPGLAEFLDLLDGAQEQYLRYGITTVQDGMVGPKELAQLSAMAKAGRLKVDTVGYLNMRDGQELLAEAKPYLKQYSHRLKIGGYKIFLDGSPQGRTAWLTEPYENGPADYVGYPIYSDQQVAGFVRQALNDRMQLLAHCNGDAAAEQLVTVFAQERAKLAPTEHRDDRPVMVHAQMVRPDQLERMATLSMIPTFFVAHVRYWGDIHLVNLGEKRAKAISPARTAQKLGLVFTFHQDSPVLPPDMLDTISCAVNRHTQNGVLLGDEERITPYEALKAVTINAAYQYFEEDDKGSLKAGKRADMVILDQTPLAVPSEGLAKIKVLATIKDGEVAYLAE